MGNAELEILKEHGYNRDFVEYAAQNARTNNYYCSSNDIPLDMIKYYYEDENLRNLFFMAKPDFYTILEYCYRLGFDDKLENYISDNFTFYNLMFYARQIGYIPIIMDRIFEILFKKEKLETREYREKLLKSLPKYYFKVARRLENGSVVSAFVTKESKHRKTYLNAGKQIVVDEGMVFDNIFSATDYMLIYKERYNIDLKIYRCTGDSFKHVSYTIDLDDYSLIKPEIKGSGFLKNIKMDKFPISF